MKSRFQVLWLLVGAAFLLLLTAGCNDNLRQFITPIPPATGDPQAPANAVTLSTNPSGDGSNIHINVSGDTNVGVVSVGISPVFLGKTGNNAFVINSGDASNPPTVTVYTALLAQTAIVNTVTLPTSAKEPVAGGTSSAGSTYIVNRGSNDVSVIAPGILSVTIPSIPVGTEPVMVAGNIANNQIFVVNHGSNNVTQISTIDNTVVGNITVGKSPIWAVMSTDGLFVFVVNQGDGSAANPGSISVIDTSLGATSPNAVIATIPVGITPATSLPNFAFYEPTLQRLYVSNTGEKTISVINANGISASNPPVKLKDITVSGNPTSVTALVNGTKAYAALGNCPSSAGSPVNHITILSVLPACTGNLVSVIDAEALVETKTIPVGTGTVSIDSSSDSSKVFAANANDSVTNSSGTHAAGTISDIRTSTDSEVIRMLAPQQDLTCQVSATVFCPVQTPFKVLAFP